MSLRNRVLLLVFVTNVIVFGAGGAFWVEAQFENQRTRLSEQISVVGEMVGLTLPTELNQDDFNVPSLIHWKGWGAIEDALVVDNSLRQVSPLGDIRVDGLELNPLGLKRRAPDFDRAAVLAACYQSARTHEPVLNVAGGLVVPIRQPWEDPVWWAVWIKNPAPAGWATVVKGLFPWFLLSTLALTLGSYYSLRKLVLDPVARLARGARIIREGDLSIRLEVPNRRDEMSDLVRAFNEMASTVQRYQAHLGDEVQRMTEEARQAEGAAMAQRRLAAMGELAAGIAHEINNPLGGLQNAVSTLERPDLPEEKRLRYLGLLERGLLRIGETVNRLRRFTPRESVSMSMDLAEVIQDACDLLRHRSERLGVELSVRTAPGTVSQVQGLRNEAGQALLNLLGNALDSLEAAQEAHPERVGKGKLALGMRSQELGVFITVRDNGPGVSMDELERVQDLFYTTKQVGKGTGLGLGLVNRCMAQHGGEVLIHSEAGVYFEVQLFFPFEGGKES